MVGVKRVGRGRERAREGRRRRRRMLKVVVVVVPGGEAWEVLALEGSGWGGGYLVWTGGR